MVPLGSRHLPARRTFRRLQLSIKEGNAANLLCRAVRMVWLRAAFPVGSKFTKLINYP